MIVVTTPTGKIGQQVLENLLASGNPLRVILREPSRLPANLRQRVEIIEGSHGNADVVNRAFEGADSVFWICPPDPRATSVEAAYLDFTRPACAAFLACGVRRVVGISAIGRGTRLASKAGLVTASLAMDDMIASTGVNYRALTMPSFMDNTLRQVSSIRSQGLFFGPIGADRKLPTCATRDIAAVAARVLLDRFWSGNGAVPVLGPEDLSCNQMAEVMSDVLAKPVRYQQVTFEVYKAGLLANGMSEAMARAMVEMMSAKNEGLDNSEPRTSHSTTPTSFRQWCQDVLKAAVLS